MADEIVATPEPAELTGLQKLIPDIPGPQGRAVRGYEILFHAPTGRIFVRTHRGKFEVSFDPKSDLPYFLWKLGGLIGRLLEQQERDERCRGDEINRINEAVADKLAGLKRQNEAMLLLISKRSGSEGSKEDLANKLEAAKAERAADKAGFEAVIRELREEVAELKGEQ